MRSPVTALRISCAGGTWASASTASFSPTFSSALENIGAELDAGADFAEFVGLLEHAHRAKPWRASAWAVIRPPMPPPEMRMGLPFVAAMQHLVAFPEHANLPGR